MKKIICSMLIILSMPLLLAAANMAEEKKDTVIPDPVEVEVPEVLPDFRYKPEEVAYLTDSINAIPQTVRAQFDALYAECVQATAVYSNPDQITAATEYATLLAYCRKHSEVQFVLFRRLGEKDILAALLIYDLAQELSERARTLAQEIYDSIQSSSMAYANAMIAARRTETPVSAVTTSPVPAAAYDLQGRRLATTPSHGLFIVGGKKVAVGR